VVDLGSTNGIIVDGRKVREADVVDGTRIDIGTTHLLVHAPAAG
jgi:pSer/pThr/pTyr-binding forkhead associated (FHA) protein